MSHWIFVKRNAVEWTPSELSLLAWYDADQISGLSDGDPVSTWEDRSGNSRDITNTSSARPLYQTNELNGKPMLEFSIAQYLYRDDAFMYANGACTVAAVVSGSGAGSQNFLLTEGRSTSNNPIYSPMCRLSSVGTANAIKVFLRNDANTAVINYLDAIQAVSNSICVIRDSGTAVDSTTDGGALTSVVASYTRSTTTLDRFAIGIMLRSSAVLGWDGKLAEVVIASSALGESDRQKLEGYLAHKWGLTANLPAGHPYKTTAPTT